MSRVCGGIGCLQGEWVTTKIEQFASRKAITHQILQKFHQYPNEWSLQLARDCKKHNTLAMRTQVWENASCLSVRHYFCLHCVANSGKAACTFLYRSEQYCGIQSFSRPLDSCLRESVVCKILLRLVLGTRYSRIGLHCSTTIAHRKFHDISCVHSTTIRFSVSLADSECSCKCIRNPVWKADILSFGVAHTPRTRTRNLIQKQCLQ